MTRLHFDWAVLLALALALVAAAPFLTRPGLPRETDAELHVYRAAELGHAIRGGALYPRWAPDLYFGYGYPIFNYYAPLSYYLANLFDLLPGVDIVGGVKAVFVLGLLVASLGSYLLGRELFGPAAGLVAAASFTFAPYVVFIDPHARGDLAEHLATCLLPLAFYAFRRLLSGVGGRWALLGSVVTLSALVFSHNLLGLVAAVLLSAYWAWEVVTGSSHSRRARALWGGLAFVLAAGLIAFFWLPGLVERDAVELNVIGAGHFDFHEHFQSLGELLAPSRVLDLGATAPRYRLNLGLAQWLLALGAPLALLRAPAPGRPYSWPRALPYFVLAGLGLVFLMLPASTPVWECVPWMAYLQFPWRLLGPANLMLAVCAAGGVSLLPTPPLSPPSRGGGGGEGPLPAAVLGAILLLALPVLYPPMWAPEFGGTAPGDIIEWERHSLALGTTSTGDFLPVAAAQAALEPQATLLESYARPGPLDKVNRATLPEGTRVEILEHGPLHDRLAVSAPTRFVLRLYTFYFPGWRAYMDGHEVGIEVAYPEGFITLWVDAGQHDVWVRFTDTPPRTTGWIISAAALVALAVALAVRQPPRVQQAGWTAETCSGASLIWLGGALLLFVALKGAVIDRQDNWMRYTSPPGQAWAAQYPQRAVFGAPPAEEGQGGGAIELLGYDLPRQRVRPGDRLPVLLYWHALVPLDANYQSFVHLARPLHILWGQEDHLNPGDLPTERWPLDQYVWDEYSIRVLPGTPPGQYVLNAGLYSMAGGYRLQRYEGPGQVVGDSVVLATVEVERPHRQPRPDELGMTQEVNVSFPQGGITLLGYAQPYPKVRLPGAWPLTLFWRADRQQPAARTRNLVLLDAEGNEVWRVSGPPADYPCEVWQAGEIVRDPLLFAVAEPAGWETGKYDFGVTLSSADGLLWPEGTGPEQSEGAEGAFVPLGRVKLRVEESE